jgi:hypothetical protein
MTWHRPADRLASKLVPLHRYRCQAPACQWEGNRRARTPERLVPPPAVFANAVIDVPATVRITAVAGGSASIGHRWPAAVAALVASFCAALGSSSHRPGR